MSTYSHAAKPVTRNGCRMIQTTEGTVIVRRIGSKRSQTVDGWAKAYRTARMFEAEARRSERFRMAPDKRADMALSTFRMVSTKRDRLRAGDNTPGTLIARHKEPDPLTVVPRVSQRRGGSQ